MDDGVTRIAGHVENGQFRHGGEQLAGQFVAMYASWQNNIRKEKVEPAVGFRQNLQGFRCRARA